MICLDSKMGTMKIGSEIFDGKNEGESFLIHDCIISFGLGHCPRCICHYFLMTFYPLVEDCSYCIHGGIGL
jgi:hypothetical protein